MNKKLQFKSVILLVALLLGGVGSAWADEVTYDFKTLPGFSDWSTSYTEHKVEYTDATVTFESANKQNSDQPIIDQPVTKGKSVSLVMNGTKTISSASFTCTQWNNKKQTITLNYSTDGGKTYKSTSVTSSNFTISSDNLPSGTNAVQITFSSNNQIGIASATITFEKGEATPTCAAPTFSIESGNYATTQNVEISTTTEGATIYYTLDGTDPTNSSTEYKGAIEVSDDAIIKAIAYLENTASSISEINITIGTAVTFTLNDEDAIEALGITLPEAGQGTRVEQIEKDGISIAATTAEGKTDTRIYQGSGDYVGTYDFRIYANGTLTFTAGTKYIKKIEFTGKSLNNLSGNNYATGTWAGRAQSVTLTATGTATIYTITVTCGNPPAIEAPVSSVQTGTYYNTQSVELTCTTVGAEIYYTIDDTAPTTTSTKYTGPIEVSETTTIKAIAATSAGESTITEVTLTFLPPIDITLTKDMETYCGTTPLDFSKSGLKVYTAKVNEGVVVLTEVTNGQVPAKRGVILTGKAGSYKAIPIESADNLQNNELYGLSSDGTVSYEYNNTYNYILQDGVFKKATGLKLKGGKAYLKTSFDVTKAGTRELKIVFDGEATAISAVKTAAADQNVYDLQGRKVTAPSKGLYIINGKKMIVK